MGSIRNIVIEDYAPEWPGQYDTESRRLRVALSAVPVSIHHIGSTSVPGLAAKPTIDILVVVRSLRDLDVRNEAMIALGYEPKGEFGIAGRRYFVRGTDDRRTHHVHAYEPGHREIAAHLDFRDYLRAHTDEALRYAELKAELALRFREDIDAYTGGKEPFIRESLERARRWRESTGDR